MIKVVPQKVSPELCCTIDGLIKFHASDPDDNVLLGYPATGIADYEEYTAKDLDRYADAAAAQYIRMGIEEADPSLDNAPVVALLAQSSFEVIVSIFALNRLGWAVFFLSPRLAIPAYVKLLQEANCQTAITTENLASTIVKIQAEIAVTSIPLIKQDDYRCGSRPTYHRIYDPLKESRKIAWIIHSSGSTGIPKPIYLTNYSCLVNLSQNFGMRSFCTSPLYHSHGIMSLFRCIYSKNPMYFYNWARPLTGKNLIQALRVTSPEMVCAVPYVLKLLAETNEGIQELSKTKLVLYAGSSCPQELGDLLVNTGVNLAGNYGSTETGYIMNSFCRPGEDPMDWNYLRLDPPNAEYILMEEVTPGLFECIALDGLPSKNTSNSDRPPNSFHTKDLFRHHPDPAKFNLWQYVTRMDDRITLINGEKVLPVPIEGHIRLHPLVKEAIVFGIGRTVPGLILFRSENADSMSRVEYLSEVWPAIEVANSKTEKFSQIPKDLIIDLPYGTPYPTTPKGTFIRTQMYEQFAEFIEKAYAVFENGSGSLKLDIPELEGFLFDAFRQLGVEIPFAYTDIFSAGIDSLQATMMWSLFKRELDLGGRQADLSQNIVFEAGNIRNLARCLFDLRVSGRQERLGSDIIIMKAMIEKFSGFRPRGDDVLLITGTTGTLGSSLLAAAVKRNNVGAVWTPVRASSILQAKERVFQTLASRGIQLSKYQESKIIAYPSDLTKEDTGLSPDAFQKLLKSLTHVIHAAWAVNFNLGIGSFEPHIRGLHNLLSLCLRVQKRSPAAFFFCSSISVAGSTPKPSTVPEAVIEDLSHAQNMGYAKSKMVAEHIVRNAMQSTGIHARVLRIGQIAGDLATGYWNERDAIPLMIQSAISTKSLPSLNEDHSWLPSDFCADVIFEIIFPKNEILHTNDPNVVYHIRNPHTIHWTRDILPSLRQTQLPSFEVLPLNEWIERVKSSGPDPLKNPSFALVDYWERKYCLRKATSLMDHDYTNLKTNGEVKQYVDDGEVSGDSLVIEMSQTLAVAPSLMHVPNLITEGYIAKFVDGWINKW
ncbi:hypothetical protein F5884DRAFT_735559 [Xylogone sp. PMI_703]|nr:hypothetical protein F5884DRAFT_735559 [Xylogone sp. PMI_703]